MNDDTDTPPSNKKYAFLAAVSLIAIVLSVFATTKAEHAANQVKANNPTGNDKSLPKVSNVTIHSSVSDKTIDAKFPYHRDGLSTDEKLDITFKLQLEDKQSTSVHITPDDCIDALEVNGKAVTLTGEALERKCNWTQGFNIDLKDYLQKGPNTLHFLIRNTGGWVGANFYPIRK